MKWFKGLVFFFFFLNVCARVAHVMMLGPRRPVLSWMLEIFRAMAMRGPSTTCGEHDISCDCLVSKRPCRHTTPHPPPPHLCLPVVPLRVPLETLGVYTDGGSHPATTAAHAKHETGCIAEDDPQTLERHMESSFQIQIVVDFFSEQMTRTSYYIYKTYSGRIVMS